MAQRVLEYDSPGGAAPRLLTMEEADGCVRIVFPVAPTWAYILPIVAGAVIGLMQAVTPILLIRGMWSLYAGAGRAEMRSFAGAVLIPAGIGTLFWWMAAAHDWWRYYRWGRVPRVLTLSDKGLVLTRLGWRRMREKTWPAGDITAVELRMVKVNLTWKRTVADLSFHRRRGRRLHFRLSSPDSELPRQIAQRMGLLLGFTPMGDCARRVRYE